MLEMPGGVDLDHFDLMFNLVPEAAQTLRDTLGVAVIGREPRIGVTRERHAKWARATQTCLAEFHAQYPAVQGMRVKELRDRIAPSLPVPAFESFLHGGSTTLGITVRNGVVRVAEHDVAASPGDQTMWEDVYPLLRGTGVGIASAVPRTQELAQACRVDLRRLTDMLYRRRAVGTVYRVGADRFCLRTTLAGLASTAATLAHASADGSFTVAQYRDAIGTGRMLAIEILECLDRVGATMRVGEARRMRDEHVKMLSEASTVTSPAAQVVPPMQERRKR